MLSGRKYGFAFTAQASIVCITCADPRSRVPLVQVLRGRMALVEPTLVAGSFMYEEGEDLEEDEVRGGTVLPTWGNGWCWLRLGGRPRRLRAAHVPSGNRWCSLCPSRSPASPAHCQVAFHSQNLTKPLSQLPGGGFATGTLVEVTDQAQQTSFRILVQHKVRNMRCASIACLPLRRANILMGEGVPWSVHLQLTGSNRAEARCEF